MKTYREIARNFIEKRTSIHFELLEGLLAEKHNPNYFDLIGTAAILSVGFDSIAVVENMDGFAQILETKENDCDFISATMENVNATYYGGYIIVTHLSDVWKNIKMTASCQ